MIAQTIAHSNNAYPREIPHRVFMEILFYSFVGRYTKVKAVQKIMVDTP
jgi:hypothetical protein